MTLNNYYEDIKDKVVVITGAGGVLCKEIGISLARFGAKVCFLDINYDRVVAVENGLKKEGYFAKGYQCNVLDEESIKEAHQKILNDFGKCDILINGAGGNKPTATTDDEAFDPNFNGKTLYNLDKSGIEFVFNLNYLGTLLPTIEFSRDMINKETSSIINISSMNAYRPLTKIPAYSGAKAAVSNLTEWLAVYFSKVKIRCNAIAPGFFHTLQNDKLLYNEDGSLTKRSEKILNGTPMNRFGKPCDLIGSILFLASYNASGFITGITIPIDGGFNAYSGV